MFGLVLAGAGSGCRFGSEVPKQFVDLDGTPLYLHALRPFLPHISQTVIVVPDGWEKRVEDEVGKIGSTGAILVTAGGPTRQESVSIGLDQLGGEITHVMVHDAARPFVAASLILNVMEAAQRHGACVPVIPVPDTVKSVRNGLVKGTVDRRLLRLVQTPQGFELGLVKRAFARARAEGYTGTDESALVERLGWEVTAIEGDSRNIKVTWDADLAS
jgi:2-C-methyl-D-erythritol 4-phosphate cytidylyltransferase